VQTPQYRVDALADLARTPLAPPGGREPQLLANLARIERQTTSLVATHYNVQPVVDVFASVQDRDLGAVAADIDQIVADVNRKLPRGTTIQLRGQIETMRSSFVGLAAGLVLAIVLVYLLMVVNYQSWLDPFVILLALPGALSGIVWALFVTHTTLNVPSLMGAIMSIGVATANSILVVTFANGERAQGADGVGAALAAGVTRFRPVVMTALAMMLGMLPMAMGLGQGGEQNAPLARAVIGGLLVATFTTLVFVPVAYSVLKRRPAVPPTGEEMELLS
jgi:multidrug efflux pump subunit AcrB